MIKEQIKKINLTWEDYPLLMWNPNLGIMIIALDNGDYLKGAICYTETDNLFKLIFTRVFTLFKNNSIVFYLPIN